MTIDSTDIKYLLQFSENERVEAFARICALADRDDPDRLNDFAELKGLLQLEASN